MKLQTGECTRRHVIEQHVVGNLLGQPKLSGDSLSSEFSVLLIANPTGDLPDSEQEAGALQELFQKHGFNVQSLIGPQQCDYLSMMGALKKPRDIIHFSGHTKSIRIEDAWTSMIPLPDGQRLLAEDIRRCLTGKPVVFLNSCHSNDIQATSANPEKQQFSAASIVRTLAQALTVGNSKGQAQAIIGSMWWINDAVAHDFATNFYRTLLEGATLGESLRKSRHQVALVHQDPG